MQIVKLDTGDFNAEAIALTEMPWQQVMTAAIADPFQKRLALAGMLRNAIVDPEKRDELDRLSYKQLIDCLNAYATAKPYEYNPWED